MDCGRDFDSASADGSADAFSSFEDAWKTAKSVEIVDNGILFGWNVWRTLENGTPIALLPFLLGHVQKEHRSVILPVTQSIWKTGLLVIAGSMALLGVFGRRGTAAAQDPLLLLMAGTSLPGGFLERFDILWMAFLLMGLLFTLGSLLFYVSLIGEKMGLWKPQNLYVRIGTVLLYGCCHARKAAGRSDTVTFRFSLPSRCCSASARSI